MENDESSHLSGVFALAQEAPTYPWPWCVCAVQVCVRFVWFVHVQLRLNTICYGPCVLSSVYWLYETSMCVYIHNDSLKTPSLLCGVSFFSSDSDWNEMNSPAQCTTHRMAPSYEDEDQDHTHACDHKKNDEVTNKRSTETLIGCNVMYATHERRRGNQRQQQQHQRRRQSPVLISWIFNIGHLWM